MDKQQLHSMKVTEGKDVINEEPKELTEKEVEEALTKLKRDYRVYMGNHTKAIFNALWKIRYTRTWYKTQKRALKHQPSFTYVDLDALMILCFVLVITDILALTTKLLGWW